MPYRGSASGDLPGITLETKHEKHLAMDMYRRFGKRAVDILLALVLLPIVLPLILLFWVLTRMDGGPGFFAQERVGLDGRHFRCWKLRTMLVNAEEILKELCESDPEVAAQWDRYQKLENDPRITRIGAFLRASSLDELPQIFNVLLGSMSLVGPRPMLPSQQDLYVSGGGEGYFRLRPGITGPWQVDGRNTTSFLERVRYDNGYFQSMSLRLDIAYMLKTVTVVLRRTGC